MKMRIVVAAGLGVVALGGALFGLEAFASSARSAPVSSRRAPRSDAPALSPVEASERLSTIARGGGERREFLHLLKAAGETCRREELLTLAAGARRTEVVEWLLGSGALPGGGERPAAPLIAAASAGHLAGVRLLLHAGAAPDPTLGGSELRMHPTPLVAAICAGSLDCADALLEAGADPHRPIQVPGFTLDAVRRPRVLRTPPAEARRLRRTTALELARLSPNKTMALVVGRERARRSPAGLVASRP